MQIDILTLFPEMFTGPFTSSILGRAQEKGLLTIRIIDIRDYTHDRHRQVDDYPYGGGSGMVMKPEPLFEAISELKGRPHVVLVTPQGQVFNQKTAKRLAKIDHLAIVCGHYEGIDERVRTACIHEEISIGDFVLTGGEIPAMAIADAVARLIPGVLGSPEATLEESFADRLLEYPQYTRPKEYRGMSVPEVLLSGNHAAIARWRRKEALRRTKERRPDLLKNLCVEDRELLREIELEEISGREADMNDCDR